MQACIRAFAALGLMVGIVLVVPVELRAGTVTVRSGNEVAGLDSQTTFLIGPPSTDFASTFTAADFTAAQSGPHAFLSTVNGSWLASLPADSAAKWISTNSNGGGGANTALYAINFNVATAFTTGSIVLHYAVDNQLGLVNQGAYLNGTALSGNTIGGGFSSQTDITRTDIASLLHVGLNTLYLDAVNVGGPAGLMFSATITTVDAAATPEPSTLAAACVAIVAGWAGLRRRKMAIC